MKSFLCIIFFIVTGNLLNGQITFNQQFENKVIQWRHQIHENPELSNREFKTAKKVANHLRSLGIEVQTGVAHTGAVSYTHLTLPTTTYV